MAEMPNSLFNKKATDKLRNPDDLDKYVQVTKPSVWIVLVACIALLAGLLSWGVFGSVATSVTGTGAVVNGKALCFLSADDVAKVHEGDAVMLGDERVVVDKVAVVPLSREEAAAVLKSDYLVSTLVSGDWAHQVTFDGDVSELPEEVPLSVTITTERIAPISLILKNWG